MIMNEAHITNITIHPSTAVSMGKTGRGLIEEILKINIYRITLEVRPSNKQPWHYIKVWICALRYQAGIYRDNNEDAIIMWRASVKKPMFTGKDYREFY